MKVNRRLPGYWLLAGMFLLASCRDNKSRPLFELLENTGIEFTNNVQYSKDLNILTFRNFYNGGGVAIGDINNDGLADVFFTANMGSNKLYLNKGNWQFEDISEKAGFTEKKQWSTGVVMADINSDGWLDIFVANSGNMTDSMARENQLFINNGPSPSPAGEGEVTFTEQAHQYGLADRGYTTQASFFDYDLDGDLDCFLVNNSPIPVNTLNYINKRNMPAAQWPVAAFLRGGGDHLLRNDNGRFVEVTQEAGIHGSLISLGLGVTIGDVNGDHYPDIYVSNDFFERDYLYINQQNGTFRDDLEKCMQHTSLASMGADIADVNNDGYPDIFTTDMLPDDDYRLKTTSSFDNIDVYRLKERSGFYHQYMQNTLQVNNKNGGFHDVANYSGVAASDWSWGALLFDADNDGLSDIFVCNGIYLDVTDQDFIDFFANDVIQKMVLTGKKEEVEGVINKMPSHPIANKAFRNLGDLKFTDAGNTWGFTQTSFSNGAAYGDLDNDGDLDLVINNVNQPAFVYRNNSRETGTNHYLSIALKGSGNNTFAIGSTIRIYTENQVISRELMPGRGFQSSVDYKIIIGLGNRQLVDSMVITWPDRSVATIVQPAVDTLHVIAQNSATAKAYTGNTSGHTAQPLLTALAHNLDRHHEDEFVDFYYERNIPVMLSREGPRAACADVNADGLEDIYIGGAAYQPGQLYLQTATGFVKQDNLLFKQYADFEDVAVVFFDADKDGDADLFIGSGGNNAQPDRRQVQHRLYMNDGKGNFSININAFPRTDVNIAVAVANDFDNDGDMDLFVGGRSVPYSYGETPASYLYVNDGKGHFTDMTKTLNPAIAQTGMVTGAVWTDITGNGQKELVIAGEWMAPRIFTYKNKRFEELSTNLTELYGWWQTVAAADLDADGDQDLVLGNMGENFYLRPDADGPVKMWMYDFDGNGSVEKIITRSIHGKDMPVFLKREITEQMPSLKKQSLRHSEYALKSMRELFPGNELEKCDIKKISYTSSCIALNDGNGKFTVQKLPPEMQWSCINAVLCTDINRDGTMDILTGGNKFGFQPQFGRLDACAAQILLNNGKAVFSTMEAKQSGINLQGEVRDIAIIHGPVQNYVLMLRNDQAPALFVLQ